MRSQRLVVLSHASYHGPDFGVCDSFIRTHPPIHSSRTCCTHASMYDDGGCCAMWCGVVGLAVQNVANTATLKIGSKTISFNRFQTNGFAHVKFTEASSVHSIPS